MILHRVFVTAATAVALISPFAAHAYCVPGPGDRPESALGPDGRVLQGGLAMSELEAGPFQGQWCGMREVGHEPLALRGSFGDVQLIGRCVYASMRDPSNLALPTTGTSVLDMRVPSKPVWTKTLRTPAMIRAYSALEMQGNLLVVGIQGLRPVVNGVATTVRHLRHLRRLPQPETDRGQ